VLYRDAAGKNHVDPAQKWIRRMGTEKQMPYDWVFAGSGFYKDVDTGEQRYLGDSGDLICVANFPTATMDLAVESAAANSGLVFEAFTDNIPPMHTLVRLVLKVSDDGPRRESDPEQGIEVPAAKSEKPQPQENNNVKAAAPKLQEKASTPPKKVPEQEINPDDFFQPVDTKKETSPK
jgi:hypothetical protein